MKKILIVLAFILCCSPAFADIIVTTGYQRIVCKIVHSDNKYVYYKINDSKTEKISNNNIISISISNDNTETITSTDTNPQNYTIPNEQSTDISSQKREKQPFNWHPSEEIPHFQGNVNASLTVSKNLFIYFGGGTSIELGSRIRDFIYIGGGVGFEYQHLKHAGINSYSEYRYTEDLFSLPIFLPIHFYIPVSEKIKPMFDFINGFSLIWVNGGNYYREDIYNPKDKGEYSKINEFWVSYYSRVGAGIEILNKHSITIGFKYDYASYCGGYLNYSYSF